MNLLIYFCEQIVIAQSFESCIIVSSFPRPRPIFQNKKPDIFWKNPSNLLVSILLFV